VAIARHWGWLAADDFGDALQGGGVPRVYAAVSSRGLGGGRRCVAFLRRADAERAHGCGSEQDGDAPGWDGVAL
jgi:hypothetical protein